MLGGYEYDLRGDRCELFPNVVSEIESSLENVVISSGEKEEMKYDVSLAKKRIEAWNSSIAQISQPRRGAAGCLKAPRRSLCAFSLGFGHEIPTKKIS